MEGSLAASACKCCWPSTRPTNCRRALHPYHLLLHARLGVAHRLQAHARRLRVGPAEQGHERQPRCGRLACSPAAAAAAFLRETKRHACAGATASEPLWHMLMSMVHHDPPCLQSATPPRTTRRFRCCCPTASWAGECATCARHRPPLGSAARPECAVNNLPASTAANQVLHISAWPSALKQALSSTCHRPHFVAASPVALLPSRAGS